MLNKFDDGTGGSLVMAFSLAEACVDTAIDGYIVSFVAPRSLRLGYGDGLFI